ncbi:unnamed protein product [Merluccius merluccius]
MDHSDIHHRQVGHGVPRGPPSMHGYHQGPAPKGPLAGQVHIEELPESILRSLHQLPFIPSRPVSVFILLAAPALSGGAPAVFIQLRNSFVMRTKDGGGQPRDVPVERLAA